MKCTNREVGVEIALKVVTAAKKKNKEGKWNTSTRL